MTRTEEIIKAADEASDEEEYLDGWEKNRCWEYFIQGAEWADKSMLEKAYKWLKENAPDYAETYGIHADGFKTYKGYDINALLEDFLKAMKED